MKKWDVYSYGMVSSSRLYALKTAYPAPNGYGEIAKEFAMAGGEAANSSIVLSRLGLKVALEGTWLGDNPEGQATLSLLKSQKVDTRLVSVEKGYEGVKEIVIADDKSRTILGIYSSLNPRTRKWSVPKKANVLKAKAVCLDPFFYGESLAVARYAQAAKIPFITVDCYHRSQFSQDAAAVIISEEYRQRMYPGKLTGTLLREYSARSKGLVIFTSGNRPILYARKKGDINLFGPHQVQTVDTSGAGDAFRAGVIFGILKNWPDKNIVQYASSVAGLVCTSFPGVLKSPTHEEVLAFIRRHYPGHSKKEGKIWIQHR